MNTIGSKVHTTMIGMDAILISVTATQNKSKQGKQDYVFQEGR